MSDTGHVPAGGMPEQPLAETDAEVRAAAHPQGYAAEPAPVRSPFTFLDDEDDDVLLMPGPQSSWAEAGAQAAQAAQPIQPAQPAPGQPYPAAGTPAPGAVPGGYEYAQQPYEAAQAPSHPSLEAQPDGEAVPPSWPPVAPPGAPAAGAPQSATASEPLPVQPPAPRRPLHAGPPIPDPSLMTGQVPVRSLADRGPAGPATPPGGISVVAQQPAPGVQHTGVVEYLDLPEEVTGQPQGGEPVIPAQPSAPGAQQPSRIAAFLADPAPIGVAEPVQEPLQGPGTPAAGIEAVADAAAATAADAPAPADAPSAAGPAADAPGHTVEPAGAAAAAEAAASAPAAPVPAQAAPVDAHPAGEAAPAQPAGPDVAPQAAAPAPDAPVPAGDAAGVAPQAPAVPGAPASAGESAAVSADATSPASAAEAAGKQGRHAGPAEAAGALPEALAGGQAVAAPAAQGAAHAAPGAPEPAQPAPPVPSGTAEAPAAPDAAQTATGTVPGGPEETVPGAEAAAPSADHSSPTEPTAPTERSSPAEPLPAEPLPAGQPDAAEPSVAAGPDAAVDGASAGTPVGGAAQPVAAGTAGEVVAAAAAEVAAPGPGAAVALVGDDAAPAEPTGSAAGPGSEPPVTEVPPMPGPLVVGADGTVVTPEVVPPAAEQPAAEAAEDPQGAEAHGPTAEPAGAPAPAGEPAEPAEHAAAAASVEPAGPAAPPYEEPLREAVHRVMRERRDVRNGFRSDPIPHDVLLRVLEAAHTAPSVGYSQPWDFVVIRSAKTRARMHELAMRQRDAYAASLPKGRAKQFKELKIEAILETPVNIVVTADRTRGGRHTLGRHSQPQMAPYSAALAVENLWLAARAEGLGVGWVSFFDEREMVQQLGLPDHLEVVAYLCVGYVDEFPAEPELAQAGWAKKRPLSWVVHEEEYGRRALPGEEPHSVLQETLRNIRPLDAKALGEAWDRQKRMTKPAGSLGMLEIISAQLCGLSRQCPPPVPEPACVAVFAGDHGVHAQGVTPWPQEVTAQMVQNILGGGAVINSFATQIGTEVCVVDVGVAAELPAPLKDGRTTGLLPRKVRPGTGDMTQGQAMTRDEVLRALEVGIETARDLVAAGNRALVTGDMGIANTTAAAALISVFTGEDPAAVTGRGTGIDDETHAHKVAIIQRALALHQPDPNDPIGVLAAVGGLEHAAIAGFLLGAASLRTPVILDGVIAGSAALAAKAIAPEVLAACIAGHRSAEPGHKAALAKLGLRPLIDLDLRLGEGTGAILALPLVQAAARAMHDVATFDSAGVTEKQ